MGAKPQHRCQYALDQDSVSSVESKLRVTQHLPRSVETANPDTNERGNLFLDPSKIISTDRHFWLDALSTRW